MSDSANFRRGHGKIVHNGNRWEGSDNAVHAAKARKKWKRVLARAFRHSDGQRTGKWWSCPPSRLAPPREST